MWAYPHCPQFCPHKLFVRSQCQCLRRRVVWGVPTLPAILPACALGSVESIAFEKKGRVGFPTRPAVLSCVPPVSVSDPQKLQLSSSAKSHDSAAFSQVFARSSSDSSPGELTVAELRTGGPTPQQKSTGFLARHRVAECSKTYSNVSKLPQDTPAWKGRSLKVLSVFSKQEQAPRVQEGAALLANSTSVQVEEVEISSFQLDKHRAWTPQAKELLFKVQQQSFNLVFVTLPTKGMSRALFANTQGPAPMRNKRYPYGFPWLSQHTKRCQRRSHSRNRISHRACTDGTKQHRPCTLRCRRNRQSPLRENLVLGGKQKTYVIWLSLELPGVLSSRVNSTRNGRNSLATNQVHSLQSKSV